MDAVNLRIWGRIKRGRFRFTGFSK